MPPTKTKSKTMPQRDSLDDFFANYPSFDYDRTASSPKEFHRMCDLFNWSNRDHQGNYPPARNAAYFQFRRAMISSFNTRFGTNVDSRRSWEHICTLLDIDPAPLSIQEMKKAVLQTHVNLSDLLDADRTGLNTHLQKFDSNDQLATYTRNSGRIFPREDAYAGGVLKFLLREIFSEYHGNRRADRYGTDDNNNDNSNTDNKTKTRGRGGGRRGRGGRRGAKKDQA